MKDTEQVSVIEGQACLGCALDMMSGRPLWDHWQATWPQTNFFSFLSFQFHTCTVISNYVQLWEFNHKEGCAPKNWCFQILTLVKTLETLLDYKEIKQVHPKGNQP